MSDFSPLPPPGTSPAALPSVPGREGYWEQSRQPWPSLLFVTPLFALYELGVALLGAAAIHNGAKTWLVQLLDIVGVRHSWAVPLLAAGVLLAWQYISQRPWRASPGVLAGMFVECCVFGVALLFIARLQGRLFGPLLAHANVWSATLAEPAVELGGGGLGGVLGRFAAFCGAGFYEEILFRLILLPVVAVAWHGCGASWDRAWLWAAVATSLVFSAAHYIGPLGDPVALADGRFWFSFTFRFVAGLFFALLFVHRGFGIAAGSHAPYDMFVGLF